MHLYLAVMMLMLGHSLCDLCVGYDVKLRDLTEPNPLCQSLGSVLSLLPPGPSLSLLLFVPPPPILPTTPSPSELFPSCNYPALSRAKVVLVHISGAAFRQQSGGEEAGSAAHEPASWDRLPRTLHLLMKLPEHFR